ncbi:hypothetical protein LPJ56_001936 [Coemansia sp. RSA 2599]|nr:hypothetical protein LPJ56_001936 [Coemansia sp. RSA 2599]
MNEEAHDPITGTPKYMSISTLLGIQYRSVITDIESFFYVMLNALRSIYSTGLHETPVGFGFQRCLRALGYIRATSLIREEWLADFGIERGKLPSKLLHILGAMRRFLFYKDGEYIGYCLTEMPPYEYPVDEASAKAYKERRKALVSSAIDISTVENFKAFLKRFGHGQKYQTFVSRYKGLFDDIAQVAPSVVDGKVIPNQHGLAESYLPNYPNALTSVGRSNQARLLACFKELVRAMGEKAAASDAPEMPYRCEDYQNMPVSGSAHQPDLVFVCRGERHFTIGAVHMPLEAKVLRNTGDIDDEDLGQILYYVQAIWQTQVTRMFVPVLFLHGSLLSLFVFTRNESIRVNIGDVFVAADEPSLDAYGPIGTTLLNIYFLLSLSPGEFGHICDFTQTPDRLYFAPRFSITGADTSQSALVSASSRWRDGSIEVVFASRFERQVSLHGRLTRIVKARYNSQDVFLKLSWLATNRIPENAIYDILASNHVQRIPRVYSSGLLIESFRDYRLDYMVMEDCGTSFSNALAMLNPRRNPSFVEVLKRIINDVTSCLVDASVVGILHQNISDSSIAIRTASGRLSACIIDWGHAKDTCWESNASRDISRKWNYDSERVGKTEEDHDLTTGTAEYMGISTLLGVKYRSVITDIESLFYVILDALRGIYFAGLDEAPIGFSSYEDPKILGYVRAPCLYRNKWLVDFGINPRGVPLEILNILEAMRRFLFFKDGEYIGLYLIQESPYKYSIDEASARVFMSKDTIALLKDRFSNSES